jgi:hypothetical protein
MAEQDSTSSSRTKKALTEDWVIYKHEDLSEGTLSVIVRHKCRFKPWRQMLALSPLANLDAETSGNTSNTFERDQA